MKSSKNRKDWFGYLMNFVAVCLGIVITFAGQGLINRHAERSEVKSSLLLVKNELQDNLSYIELADSILAKYSAAAGFLSDTKDIIRMLRRIQCLHIAMFR